jgi:hypothetical protein
MPDAALQLRPQHADHIVRGDDAGQFIVLVHYGLGLQVLFVEQFRDFIFFDALMSKNQRFLG